mmetsp:Transcript_48033/g.154967  ORF Transcript_48033/g.154967 Transcript_48033/m.154967 type:complete len:214 (+) Transcript_48033:1175-1816(+)
MHRKQNACANSLVSRLILDACTELVVLLHGDVGVQVLRLELPSITPGLQRPTNSSLPHLLIDSCSMWLCPLWSWWARHRSPPRPTRAHPHRERIDLHVDLLRPARHLEVAPSPTLRLWIHHSGSSDISHDGPACSGGSRLRTATLCCTSHTARIHLRCWGLSGTSLPPSSSDWGLVLHSIRPCVASSPQRCSDCLVGRRPDSARLLSASARRR